MFNTVVWSIEWRFAITWQNEQEAEVCESMLDQSSLPRTSFSIARFSTNYSGSILRHMTLMRRDWLVCRLRDASLWKVACDSLRGYDESWAAELYCIYQFRYEKNEDTFYYSEWMRWVYPETHNVLDMALLLASNSRIPESRTILFSSKHSLNKTWGKHWSPNCVG